MVTLELSHQAFVINGRDVEFPLQVSLLRELLGASRSCKKPQNVIYTWDVQAIEISRQVR